MLAIYNSICYNMGSMNREFSDEEIEQVRKGLSMWLELGDGLLDSMEKHWGMAIALGLWLEEHDKERVMYD